MKFLNELSDVLPNRSFWIVDGAGAVGVGAGGGKLDMSEQAEAGLSMQLKPRRTCPIGKLVFGGLVPAVL